MKIFKKILCTFLIVLMCLTAAPLDGFVGIELPNLSEWFAGKVSAATELAATGQCGDNVYWNYDSTTGELVISGTGAMWDYSYSYNSLFYNKAIKSIVVEEGVTQIGNNAFPECDSLISITIPSSVTSIGYGAFLYCESLASVTIPNSVESIGVVAFGFCSSLTSITIPDSVVSIDHQAFEYCTSLESVKIGKGVVTIGSLPFVCCESLVNIEVDDANQYYCDIDGVLFTKDLTKLIVYPVANERSSYTIPNGVVTIGADAFYYCENLTSVSIPNGVKYIEGAAFAGCKNLGSLALPNSVISIAHAAFWYCENLTYIEVAEGNSYFCSVDGVLFNKRMTDLFLYPAKNSRTSYNVPDGVTKFEDGAFRDCANLVSVTLPESLTRIDSSIFENCTNLESIEIPNKVTFINFDAFKNCISIKSVTIADSVTSISSSVFEGCTSLVDVKLSTNINSISYNSFKGCINLTNIIIPDGVSDIGSNAFEGCTSLKSITIPNSVTNIGWSAFYNCTDLVNGDVYFNGTEEEWNAIIVDTNNEPLLNANIHFLGDGEHTHEFGEWTVVKAPSCTYAGVAEATCTVCGEKQYKSIDKNPDAHIEEIIPGTPAECTLSGISDGKRCSKCGKILVECEMIDALGHNLVVDVAKSIPATCTESGIDFLVCSRCRHTEERSVDPLDHTWSEWEEITASSCDTQGLKRRICSVCNTIDEQTVDSHGGHVVEILPVKYPTCTETGKTSGSYCSVCGMVFEAQIEIPALGHRWDEWEVTEEPTVVQQGKKTRTCSVCGETETEIIDRLEIDWEANENYGKANFTVVDAKTLNPINNAWINIFTEDGETSTYVTDSQGKVSIVLPVGEVKFAAGAEGKKIRNLKYNITHAEIDVPTIALSSDPLIDAEFTKKDMTREEIIDAGINIEDPDNTHVVEYTVTVEYEGEKRVIAYYEDDDGNRYYPGDEPDTPGGGYIIGGNTVYLTEKFYLIIKGQVSWLKQMFEVEMRVYNNSPLDTFEDAQATLILPEGLSLASMVDGEQTLTQNLGTVAENSQTSCKWYVRGDKAGTYSISANLKGVLMPFKEEFNHTYVAEDPIVVYDENAIKLYVKAPEKVVCGKEFSVIIGVENISDITLYNMSHVFTDLSECFVRHYSNGEVITEFYAYDPIGMGKFAEEFKPGDKLELEYKSSILLNSEKIKNTIFNLVDIVIDAGDVKAEINNNFGYHDEHSMGEYSETKPATCTEPGTQVAKCEYCGYEEIAEIPAKGHVDADTDIYCDVCGEKISEWCDLIGHDYHWVTTTPATCTEKGEETKVCQREDCGLTNGTREIPALCHEAFEYIVPATCTVNGYKMITCIRCYEELGFEILEATGHIGGTYIKNQKEVTCTEDGYTGDTCCTTCDAVLTSGEKIDKLGHDAVVHTQPALCTSNGFTITICGRCYELLDYVVITVLGHNMGNPVSNEDGTHTSECEREGCTYTETSDCTYGDWAITTESTCIVAGEKSRVCTACGYTETEELPLAEHTPGEAIIENKTEPECEKEGHYDSVVYCSVCNEELSRETVKTDKLGHDWDDGEVVNTASCTVKEEVLYTCKRDASHTRVEFGEVDPDNHIGDTYFENQKAATCTEDGYTGDIHCSDCRVKLSSGNIVDKLGHDPIEHLQPESCTVNGYKITICGRCYELLAYDIFNKLGHDMSGFTSNEDGTHTSVCQRDKCTYTETNNCTYSEWSIVRESTCKVAGEKTRACTVCGYSETHELALAEHIPGEVVVENNIVPKCEEDGQYDNVVYCSVCTEELSRETIVVEKLGHDWDDGNIIKIATCIEKEEVVYTCKNDASHTRTEIGDINPDNHIGGTNLVNDKSATCTEDGYTGDVYCSSCNGFITAGNIINKLGHDMGEWITVKEATLLEEGKLEKYCSRCDYTETQTIPRLTGKVSVDVDSGVSVEYPDDSYDEDIQVDVKEEFDGSQFLTQQYANIKAWNIKTYIGGEEVQPKVPVLVRIPLPADYNDSTIAVFHIDSNTDTRERIEPVNVENGYICFIAKSFSVYIMVDESSLIHNHKDDNHDGKCDGCDYDFTSDCSCKCHKTGIIAKIIWKITIFFNKLLRRNKICSCGIYHY